MKTKETILKEHVCKYFDENKMTTFEDVPNAVFYEAMEEYAEEKVKNLALPRVSKCDGLEREALLLDFMGHIFDLKDKRYSQDFAKNTVNDYLKIKK